MKKAFKDSWPWVRRFNSVDDDSPWKIISIFMTCLATTDLRITSKRYLHFLCKCTIMSLLYTLHDHIFNKQETSKNLCHISTFFVENRDKIMSKIKTNGSEQCK